MANTGQLGTVYKASGKPYLNGVTRKYQKKPRCVNHPRRFARYSSFQVGTASKVVWCDECHFKFAAKMRNFVSVFKVRMLGKEHLWKGAIREHKKIWIKAIMDDRHRFEDARKAAMRKYKRPR